MTEGAQERKGVTIVNVNEQPVVCGECRYGIFLVDLLIPGGLRFTCRGCDTQYDKRQLEILGRKQAKAES